MLYFDLDMHLEFMWANFVMHLGHIYFLITINP